MGSGSAQTSQHLHAIDGCWWCAPLERNNSSIIDGVQMLKN